MRSRKAIGPDVAGLRMGTARSQASLRFADPPSPRTQSREVWLAIHVLAFNDVSITLERIAASAQRFTPRVSLAPPDGLVLEVKGSLHLFKGADGLIKAVTDECVRLRINATLAVAPTPLAAIVAARVGTPMVVMDRAQLVGRLSSMPLAPLRWPDEVVQGLARMGVRTIGHVLRLPRAGFARRFGPAQLAELDRLTGRGADLRRHFRPRERFRRRREMTYELDDMETILMAMGPILADLGRFLQERQCGVTEIECRFRHRHAPDSRCVLRLAAPMADVARLTELLHVRLSSMVLPEPVRSCEVCSGVPVLRTFQSSSVWQSGEYGGSRGAECSELIEMLRARLGTESVYGLQVLAGHRPEVAWSRIEPGTRADSSGTALLASRRGAGTRTDSVRPPWRAFRRPLWLLAEPELLEETEGRPRRRGCLRLVGDVERIETGWWDGRDAGRDYYRAYDVFGVLLWIFRERAEPHRWFLHGVFG